MIVKTEEAVRWRNSQNNTSPEKYENLPIY